MDCREFRNKHVGFVDDTLPAVEMEAMRHHLEACRPCARRDTAVRRSLLLVRNLPCIEPSPDFMARLNDRLRAVEPARGTVHRVRAGSFGAFAALAAGIALVAFAGYEMSVRARGHELLRLPPVVASTPELPPPPVATPAFAASVPTGMGVWPAVMMAGDAQLHMASLELQDMR